MLENTFFHNLHLLEQVKLNIYILSFSNKRNWLTWKHSLNDKQILHLIVIYRLSYLQHCYPNKFDEIKDIPSSKNMNEYFSKSKEELQVEYNKIKVNVGGN